MIEYRELVDTKEMDREDPLFKAVDLKREKKISRAAHPACFLIHNLAIW